MLSVKHSGKKTSLRSYIIFLLLFRIILNEQLMNKNLERTREILVVIKDYESAFDAV